MPRITFVRHSQARQVRGGKDSERTLTREGRRIAARRKKMLSTEFDLGIVSYTARTLETFKTITDVHPYVVTKTLIHSANEADEAVLEDAWQQLGHSPLSAYLGTSDAVCDAMTRHGNAMWDFILSMADATLAENTIVVGHDIWMQAAVLAGLGWVDKIPPALDQNWPFCGGVEVEFESNSLSRITPLPAIE